VVSGIRNSVGGGRCAARRNVAPAVAAAFAVVCSRALAAVLGGQPLRELVQLQGSLLAARLEVQRDREREREIASKRQIKK
jgi:hypothetical protein